MYNKEIEQINDEKIKRLNYLLDKLDLSISKLENLNNPKSTEYFSSRAKEFWK